MMFLRRNQRKMKPKIGKSERSYSIKQNTAQRERESESGRERL